MRLARTLGSCIVRAKGPCIQSLCARCSIETRSPYIGRSTEETCDSWMKGITLVAAPIAKVPPLWLKTTNLTTNYSKNYSKLLGLPHSRSGLRVRLVYRCPVPAAPDRQVPRDRGRIERGIRPLPHLKLHMRRVSLYVQISNLMLH